MPEWSKPELHQAISDETKQAVLDTIYQHWREIRNDGAAPSEALDALIDGILAAAAELITATTTSEHRENIPRIAAERLIHKFKTARERGY